MVARKQKTKAETATNLAQLFLYLYMCNYSYASIMLSTAAVATFSMYAQMKYLHPVHDYRNVSLYRVKVFFCFFFYKF